MKSVFWKTFGGLSAPYYLRHFAFGLMFPAFLYFSLRHNPGPPAPPLIYLLVIANAFLYPYSRFAYEGVVSFILGENFFFINMWVMLFAKFLTMFACWLFAIAIAPLGLVYLYVRHSREGG
jgi:hypothetical protein